MKSYKDLLVQYKGGGYDGCFWEWNFFLFDQNGKFHNLFTSGRNGIKNESEAIEMLKEEYLKDHSDIYLYNLNIDADIENFQAENSPLCVAPVCNKVNDIYEENEAYSPMFYICSYCERKVFPSDHDNYPSYFHDDQAYYGAHAFDCNNDTMLCEECYLNRCDKCESIINIYDEKEKTFVIKKKSKWGIDEQYVCKDCYDNSGQAILNGEEPCIMSIPYDKDQLNIFKEYTNQVKIISKYVTEENREEIKQYLKDQGFDIE